MNDIITQANELFSYSQDLRRDFHRHPEMGFKEVRTAGIVARELRQLGLEVSTGIAHTGVVALLEGGEPGPIVLVRFDMDALPIQEDTHAKYASENAGIMHACGHDGHVAIGLTVARLLYAHRHTLRGKVKFVYQPAEEGMGGAELMIEEGVLENPKPDLTLSMHLWNDMQVGNVAVLGGPLMAGGEIFHIKLTGKGGHGALPHQSIDPVVAAANIITACQSIVARNVSPTKSAVISFTQVKAGDAFNIIPQTVEMAGTIRTFEPEVRKLVIDRLTEVVKGVGESLGCQVDIDIKRLTPAVINDYKIAETIQAVVKNQFTQLKNVSGFQLMVSEDMAYMMERVPGCYILIGSANTKTGLDFGHHHPKFDFDETALTTGAAVMTASILKILS